VADVLQANPRANVHVFVVWEPVLLTDWRRPPASQTSYVPDHRAAHYWDIGRRLSALYGGSANLEALAETRRKGFRMKNVVWDTALVYPPGVRWGQPAKLLVAPVVDFRDDLAKAIP
jgi:hypothetical protein